MSSFDLANLQLINGYTPTASKSLSRFGWRTIGIKSFISRWTFDYLLDIRLLYVDFFDEKHNPARCSHDGYLFIIQAQFFQPIRYSFP